MRSPHGTPNFVLGASNYHRARLVTRVHKPEIAKPRKPRNLSTMWITRISWFPKSKKSMSKSTIIECALDGEIHKIHEIQINRTHPVDLRRTVAYIVHGNMNRLRRAAEHTYCRSTPRTATQHCPRPRLCRVGPSTQRMMCFTHHPCGSIGQAITVFLFVDLS